MKCTVGRGTVQYCNDGENISKATSIAGYSDVIPYQLVSNCRTKTSPCLFEACSLLPKSSIYHPILWCDVSTTFDDKMNTCLLEGSE